MIYDYLLLDPPTATLGSAYDDDDDMYDSSDYSDSYFDDEMDDLDHLSPYGIPMADMCDGIFNEVYNLGAASVFGGERRGFGPLDISSSDSIDDGDESSEDGRNTRLSNSQVTRKIDSKKEKRIKRHLAILRTNRQIYDEASTLLHSKLMIEVEPGDALTEYSGSAIVVPSKKVWRHAPFPGPFSRNVNGEPVYEGPLLDGSLEPHVFARYETIRYFCEFDLLVDNAAPRLYVDDDCSVRGADADELLSYLNTSKGTTRWVEDPLPNGRHDNGLRDTLKDVADITISRVTVIRPSIVTGIIQKFVDLLSSSLFVRHLEIVLDIGVGCSSVSENTDFSDDSSDDEDPEQEAKDDEKICVADQRATELLLESTVLNPLRSLSNVKTFTLTVDTLGRGDEVMKLGKKHLEIIGDLKEAIEKNCAVKHGTQ